MGKSLSVVFASVLAAATLQLISAPAAMADSVASELVECHGKKGGDKVNNKKCVDFRRASGHTWAVEKSAEWGCGGKDDKFQIGVKESMGEPRNSNAPYIVGVSVFSLDPSSAKKWECGHLRNLFYTNQCESELDRFGPTSSTDNNARFDCIEEFASAGNAQELQKRWNTAVASYRQQYANYLANPVKSDSAVGGKIKPKNTSDQNSTPQPQTITNNAPTPEKVKAQECSQLDEDTIDQYGKKFKKVWTCAVIAGSAYSGQAPMWRDSKQLGVGDPGIYASRGEIRVACAKKFKKNPNPVLGSGKNDYWAWTRGTTAVSTDGVDDNGSDLWGWLPLTFIKQGDDFDSAGIGSCPDKTGADKVMQDAVRKCPAVAAPVEDQYGKTFKKTWNCRTTAENPEPGTQIPMWRNTQKLSGEPDILLNYGNVQVACVKQFKKSPNPTVNGRDNNYWAWAAGDTAVTNDTIDSNGDDKWGWVPLSHIQQGDKESKTAGIGKCPSGTGADKSIKAEAKRVAKLNSDKD